MDRKSFKLNIIIVSIFLAFAVFSAAGICPVFGATAETAISSGETAGVSVSGTGEADIRDIAYPMSQNIEPVSNAPVIVFLAAVLLLAWVLYARLSGKGSEIETPSAPPEPVIPPHVTALLDLEALSASDLLSRREFKLWYMRLSRICRVYIGDSLDFNCVDSDACEIMAKLESKRVSPALITRFDDILSECDLVKFAKASPGEADAREALQKCVDAVKKSRDVNFK